ncbi:unnamed protein product [Lactuca virosa]|uniref:Uncharacterized protein n=1 Tax=Lactuca virosa TaxID=75947 RepID=A0AAU9NAA0_9ASTR|nr:unnamed protein product [Lactuca virosa]
MIGRDQKKGKDDVCLCDVFPVIERKKRRWSRRSMPNSNTTIRSMPPLLHLRFLPSFPSAVIDLKRKGFDLKIIFPLRRSSFPFVSSALFSHNVSFTTTPFSNPNLKSYKLNNRRTLTVSALGVDTFDGTTLAVIGGGSVAAIAAVISLADPEKRRQLQAEEVGGQVHVSSGSGSFFPGYLLKKSIRFTFPNLPFVISYCI